MRFLKGGGGGGPSKQVVEQTNLPEFAEPYVTRLFQRGEAESLQPYSTYGGPRLAPFTRDEMTSQAMTRGFASAGTPSQLTDASQLIGDIASTGTNINPYERMSFEDGLSKFMNPYQQAVTDIAKREAIRDSNILSNQIGSKAALSGGLGGYREAIMQSERERNLGDRLGDIQTKGLERSYTQALGQLDRERRLGLSEEQLRQAGDKLGLAGAQVLGDIGQDIQKDALSRIGALSDIGQRQRAFEQASLDMGYQDFINQRDYTRNQLAGLAGLLYGAPIQPNVVRSTYEQQPGLFQQMAGAGLAGAGLYKNYMGGA